VDLNFGHVLEGGNCGQAREGKDDFVDFGRCDGQPQRRGESLGGESGRPQTPRGGVWGGQGRTEGSKATSLNERVEASPSTTSCAGSRSWEMNDPKTCRLMKKRDRFATTAFGIINSSKVIL
jgi:hypothetical protein